MAVIDHLVFVSPDLDAGIAYIELLTGVGAAPGGTHVGRGTHNALLSLGPGCYLEIIGIDPDQPPPDRPRPFGITPDSERHLHTFAVRPDTGQSLHRLIADLAASGVAAADPLAMQRVAPDGQTLAWQMAPLDAPAAGVVAPFLIDWGDTPHPGDGAPEGCTLDRLWIQHPVPGDVAHLHDSLGLDVETEVWPRAALRAEIIGAHGPVDLR